MYNRTVPVNIFDEMQTIYRKHILLMTLPTAPQRSVSTAASGYIISTGALRGAGFPPAPPKNKATKHLSFSLYNKQVIINKCKAADLYYEIGCLAIL